MTHLLHIDSSPRSFSGISVPYQSVTRMLTHEFVTAWKVDHPNGTVTCQDLGRNPVPHVDEQWIAAAYTPPEQRTDELVVLTKEG